MKNNIFRISLIVTTLGILSLSLEYIFYQYVDDDGLLHESLFMPIGVVLLILGFSSIVFCVLRKK